MAKRVVSIDVQPPKVTRVLLVEHNPVLGRIYSCALVAAGHAIDLAGDEEEGFERLLAGSYDVLVSDLGVPPAPGLELMRKVRRWRPGVPIVLMAEQLDQEMYSLSREMGMVRYLIKPMSMEQLAHAVESAAMLGAVLSRSGDRRGTGR
jgi:DNA-binding response OmpR family regulator